jgi:hypothetical protein
MTTAPKPIKAKVLRTNGQKPPGRTVLSVTTIFSGMAG